jgi:hypothetical protein
MVVGNGGPDRHADAQRHDTRKSSREGRKTPRETPRLLAIGIPRLTYRLDVSVKYGATYEGGGLLQDAGRHPLHEFVELDTQPESLGRDGPHGETASDDQEHQAGAKLDRPQRLRAFPTVQVLEPACESSPRANQRY